MFSCWVCIVSIYKYLTIWVNTNSTCLLNESKFLNLNFINLLNGSVMLICLLDFIKTKKI